MSDEKFVSEPLKPSRTFELATVNRGDGESRSSSYTINMTSNSESKSDSGR